jgi:hypothetical protein
VSAAPGRLEQRPVLLAQVLEQHPRLEQVADAQQELGQIERLGDEVFGAELERALARFDGAVAGDHQHGQAFRGNALGQHFEHGEAVAAGHVAVRDDEIGRRLGRRCPSTRRRWSAR